MVKMCHTCTTLHFVTVVSTVIIPITLVHFLHTLSIVTSKAIGAEMQSSINITYNYIKCYYKGNIQR